MTIELFNAARILTGTAPLETGLDVTPWMTRATLQTHEVSLQLSQRLADVTPRLGDTLVAAGHEAGLAVAEPCLKLAVILLGGG